MSLFRRPSRQHAGSGLTIALLFLGATLAMAQPIPAGRGISSITPIPGSGCGYGPAVWKSSATTGLYHCVGGIYVAVGSGTSAGTVTSVVATVPAYMTLTGSPITTSGALAFDFAAQSGRKFLASPSDGTSGAPAMRALVAADVPTLNQSTTGNALTSSDGLTSASGTPPLTLSLAAKALTGSISITPANPGGAVALQATTPGTPQTGSANLSGTVVAGGFSGPLTGNVTGNVTGSAGNAATANALAANGTNCSSGNAPTGVDASGNSENCQALPANTTSTTSNFFSAYNSATGAFTKAQPSSSDISGLAASATTDATNASNIGTGTLASARGGAGTVSGALKGNGSGAVSQAACADLSNASIMCSSADAANLSGSLAAARLPGFTGDITTTAGAVATTISAGAVTDDKASLAVKPSCGLVATSNLTLSGVQTIDGVLGSDGVTLVLATAQTTASQNGPWIMRSTAWTRPTWYPAGGTAQAFQFITTFIRLGSTYSGSTWRMTTSGAVTIDTTSTTWAQTPMQLTTTSVAGALPVANGGTGATTLTANNVVLGNGTSAPLFVAPGSSGNVLTSNGTTWASSAPASSGANTTLSNLGTTSINASFITAAGQAATFTATSPAASASSQAGAAASLTASAATAGTSNAGASAGGAVTITSGAAARLTSGNAPGGDIVEVTGAGIGTGLQGFVDATGTAGMKLANGVVTGGQGAINFPSTGFSLYSSNNGVVLSAGGVAFVNLTNLGAGGGVMLKSSGTISWGSGTPDTNSNDTGLSRVVASVLAVGNGTGGDTTGFVRYGGTCTVASDQTNATTTLQTMACYQKTSGSVAISLVAGRTYAGVCEFFLSDSVAADGSKIDFNAGTATATTFRAQVTAFDTALNLSTQTTALATAASATTFTGAGAFEVHLTFKVNAAGTFQPQFAQVGHTTGTLTLAAGSHCILTDVTP